MRSAVRWVVFVVILLVLVAVVLFGPFISSGKSEQVNLSLNSHINLRNGTESEHRPLIPMEMTPMRSGTDESEHPDGDTDDEIAPADDSVGPSPIGGNNYDDEKLPDHPENNIEVTPISDEHLGSIESANQVVTEPAGSEANDETIGTTKEEEELPLSSPTERPKDDLVTAIPDAPITSVPILVTQPVAHERSQRNCTPIASEEMVGYSDKELVFRQSEFCRGNNDLLARVFFIIISGNGTQDARIPAATEAWIQYLNKGNYAIVSEKADVSLNVITYPELQGMHSHLDSCDRPYMVMHELLKTERYRQFDWFVTVDDDTWVNLHQLEMYLTMIDRNPTTTPTLIGRYFNHRHVSGGAGIFLSQAAMVLLAVQSLPGGGCEKPFQHRPNEFMCHDNSWPPCMIKYGNGKQNMVNSDFLWYKPPPPDFDHRKIMSWMTWHHLSPDQMRDLGRKFPYSEYV